MGQVLHGSATTTASVRRAIQNSQESLRVLASRHGINPKTVQKWRKRETVADRKTGPAQPRSSVLSLEEEAAIVAFRRHTLLALDDCLYPCSRASPISPGLPCIAAFSGEPCRAIGPSDNGERISRLPEVEGDKPTRRRFKRYPIGFFHIDIAELRTAEGKLYLFIAIDRTSKFAFVQRVERANTRTASAFLEALVQAVPYRIHAVLTDDCIQFADLPKNRKGPTAMLRGHPFDRTCLRHAIEHRLTKPNHPWTNGQVERMNRTIKDATVRRYHYHSHDQLRRHLGDFLNACNLAPRLKTLSGLTPYEYLCKIWTNEPQRFTGDPLHQMSGLNTFPARSTSRRSRSWSTATRCSSTR